MTTFQQATYDQLELLLAVVNTNWKYGRNWEWLILWCDGEACPDYPVNQIIEMFSNDSTWVDWDKN